MLFNSISFIWFFIIVTGLYFGLPHKFRWIFLLVASCYFYMAFIPAYILILLVTILIDYFAAIYIEQSEGRKRKQYLIISIVTTCLVLFVFKYFNFFNSNFSEIAKALSLNYPVKALEIILPIGLSFHTFQSLSYVIEVYRGNQKAERHFGIYSLYVMFYPQLVAGPIERPQNLLHQFYKKHTFEYSRVTSGLKLMAWGMFKKVVIADKLAVYVNEIYGQPTEYSSFPLILATLFFTYQIYCDFSGYSDIAIGSARVMGIDLMKNFDSPYFSKSVSEFWKRWHISLSTWFKDYVYISMGGNRVSKTKQSFNLLITFLISGFWHGANWTYVAWGGLNGFYLVFAQWTSKFRAKIKGLAGLQRFKYLDNSAQLLITFVLIALSWVFFRADNISNAVFIIQKMFSGFIVDFQKVLHNVDNCRLSLLYLNSGKLEFIRYVLPIVFLEVVYVLHSKYNLVKIINSQSFLVRMMMYYFLLVAIIFLGQFHDSRQQFIYFQF